jgi:hypothetical protein
MEEGGGYIFEKNFIVFKATILLRINIRLTVFYRIFYNIYTFFIKFDFLVIMEKGIKLSEFEKAKLWPFIMSKERACARLHGTWGDFFVLYKIS